MSLTWHIIRKDSRRHSAALGVWVGFIIVSSVWFLFRGDPEHVGVPGAAEDWVQMHYGLALMSVVLQAGFGALLAATLVQEDPPVISTTFWPTRPISRRRMLGAKLLGGFLLLVGLPAGVLVPVWLGVGFSPAQALGAGLEHVAWQAAVVVPALGVAALGGGLGRFLISGLALGSSVTVAVVAGATPPVEALMRTRPLDVRTGVVAGIILVGGVTVLALAYAGRSRLRWAGAAATLAAVIGVRVGWSEPVEAARPTTVSGDGSVRWERLESRDGESVVLVRAPGVGRDGTLLAPTAGLVELDVETNGERIHPLQRGKRWGEAAAASLLPMGSVAREVTWELAPDPTLAGWLREGRKLPAARLRLLQARARVLWELPLRESAEISVGSAFSRVLQVGWTDDFSRRRIILRERDARLAWQDGFGGAFGPAGSRRADEVRADCFLLVHRGSGYAAAAALQEAGVARMHAMMVSVRRLEFAPAVPDLGKLAAWDQGAVLVKVRFAAEGAEVRTLGAAQIPAALEGSP